MPRSRAPLFLFGVLAAPALAQDCTWDLRQEIDLPEARAGAKLAFDPHWGVAVLYGGTVGTLITSFKPDTTWEWTGSYWSRAAESAPLGGRIYHAMCYDPVRHKTLLFGGYTAASPYTGDTWAYDRSTNWMLRATSGPSPRHGAGMTFDSGRGVAVLFGGYDGTTRLNDTWEWDGTSWTQRLPGGSSSPPGRTHAPLAYDTVRGRTVLFGGEGPSGYLGDTWEWNGSDGTWTAMVNVPPPPAGPNPRALCGFTYDSQRHAVVMHAGQQPGATGNTDLWAWDGTTWTQLAIAPGPAARYDAPLVYDPTRGNFLLFGGHIPYPVTAPSTSNETWVLSCGTPPPCYPNCDGSNQPPVLNVADFTCFLQRFAAADPYANCDGSNQPPVLNVADFTCFLQSFAAGCP